ncbi:hypothetical protein AB8O55_14280 [Saccharopolyspora cebuensis]|uniref:Uncharacterized protein n=1 Tax=Saccharopolyspora cebuensis TaxID=418759 RepID=A0ABV4CMC3_9PSEU
MNWRDLVPFAAIVALCAVALVLYPPAVAYLAPALATLGIIGRRRRGGSDEDSDEPERRDVEE